jgi:hypothetical protein
MSDGRNDFPDAVSPSRDDEELALASSQNIAKLVSNESGSSFASLRFCVFAFISPKQPGSLREIHYLNGLYLRCIPLLKSYLV